MGFILNRTTLLGALGALVFAVDQSFKNRIEAEPEGSLPRDMDGKRGSYVRFARYHNRGFALGRLKERPELVKSIGTAGCASLLLTYVTALIRRESLQGLLSGRRLILSLLIAVSAMGLYIFLTIERAHSVEYLRSIFEMRDPGLPIWVIQPYIYVANNFDNLNCLVRDLSQHTHGLRMLYPLLVFTGIKFFHPELVSFPIYVTKEELTTLTIAYDAYYDFGIPGVVIFALVVLGFIFNANLGIPAWFFAFFGVMLML